MAIFYKHIKGCGENTIGSIGSLADAWSWIKWASTENNKLLTTSQTYLPEIWVSTTNDFNNARNCGKILTSDATNQQINKFMDFNGGLYAQHIKFTDSQNEKNLYIENDVLYISSLSEGSSGKTEFSSNVYTFKKLGGAGTRSFIVEPEATFNSNTTVKRNLHIGSDTTYSFPTKENEWGTIKADYKCEALFFNATSDRRAKTDITPASFSALSVVQNLPVYSFKYNTNPTPVIGLIAQEAAYYNLDGFNMVDNLLATGENSDFMQMKESKLVYVLWKAVQELSDQVNDLKSQLASLK